ncbi:MULTISPECIES: RIP metalloprotease RseP [Marivita]|uniref:Zinc metalloprotease n=1 Tax=Marivita cryptomonadis TaxID=505252 RepID=A0A9Q2PAP3_9RHOB|nr:MULTISPECIES: RIP metalloprotease RseP [Marivita]MCR9167671.1 RIP metalloprotease RseP [Paracoccaceae bacterium]MBM2322076.1 RIP metalloprotease RseP [Marivita cryptomonadis]MBM2331657.1 RIP metalloprotease RseP [Marivita cryptomonadis]MBM2341242.1 RIP metalloprotease RseP [Marivita cryptomonadis]MBM2345905.1 RIP metalloprotease RseP [Marivita cryptomonadis]
MDIAALLPQFGSLIWTLLAFVIALSIIVAIHEYGHYIVGRWSGIDAEVFSLGFGPVLFSRVDKRGTKWQFALLPLGGYVKFKGDSNASGGKDDEAMSKLSDAERRRTMNGAPLWARAATVAAGPVFNFALSILIFTGVLMLRGEVTDPVKVGELRAVPAQNELQVGDVLLEIEGVVLPAYGESSSFQSFLDDLPVQEHLNYTVQRGDSSLVVEGPYVYPPVATQIIPRSAADDAGFRAGDIIVSVDGTPIYAFEQLRAAVEGSEGATLTLEVWRDGDIRDLEMTPRRTDEPQSDGTFETNYRIGIVGGMFFEPATEMTGPFSALLSGVQQTGRIIDGSLSGLWYMITGAISTCNLSGPIGIAETSGSMASQGTTSFIWFIAVLSTAVGLLNLFPIPVLDGGHLVFHAYEAVTGRPPSDKALRVLMAIGLTLLLSLMLFALSNDLFCP